MFLKRIEISNYSQLSHVVLDFQEDLTVLAGPNNSGKTTLISVLKGIFNDNKLAFLYSDIPTNLSVEWVDKIMPIFKSIMVANAKDTGVSEIIKAISIDDQFSSDYIIDEFKAQIEVEYIPETDDIQNFVDYLMDLDESKHSFYFIYTYKPKLPNNKDGEEDSEFSIRRIVKSTENNKTDFMYSVILSGNEEKLLPEYIRKGLLWLVKQ